MIEIRPIYRHEAGEFLRLLCTVFELDFDRASKVFFADPLFDLNRKWGLFASGKLTSILTTTPLEFKAGTVMGIAGVATAADARGMGYAGKLLDHVVRHGVERNERKAMLFAHQEDLYVQHGFEPLDRIVKGIVRTTEAELPPAEVPFKRVQQIYTEWASQSPHRLIRTPLRWRYWRWPFRVCENCAGGYICYEGACVREAIRAPGSEWIGPIGVEWVGLERVTESLQIPLASRHEDLTMMGLGFDTPPELFITDQF
ncbi:MAG: GNAT family N-acetyltransferase [Armatimonadetes bacterium]|nr:GNAT family N-acetyltransferase [Armatimonadota bacterium]